MFAVKVEDGVEGRDGQLSVGPVYRNPLAADDFPPLDPHSTTTWNIFRLYTYILCFYLGMYFASFTYIIL